MSLPSEVCMLKSGKNKISQFIASYGFSTIIIIWGSHLSLAGGLKGNLKDKICLDL